jgi:hypothetical protein
VGSKNLTRTVKECRLKILPIPITTSVPPNTSTGQTGILRDGTGSLLGKK